MFEEMYKREYRERKVGLERVGNVVTGVLLMVTDVVTDGMIEDWMKSVENTYEKV